MIYVATSVDDGFAEASEDRLFDQSPVVARQIDARCETQMGNS